MKSLKVVSLTYRNTTFHGNSLGFDREYEAKILTIGASKISNLSKIEFNRCRRKLPQLIIFWTQVSVVCSEYLQIRQLFERFQYSIFLVVQFELKQNLFIRVRFFQQLFFSQVLLPCMPSFA